MQQRYLSQGHRKWSRQAHLRQVPRRPCTLGNSFVSLQDRKLGSLDKIKITAVAEPEGCIPKANEKEPFKADSISVIHALDC